MIIHVYDNAHNQNKTMDDNKCKRYDIIGSYSIQSVDNYRHHAMYSLFLLFSLKKMDKNIYIYNIYIYVQ